MTELVALEKKPRTFGLNQIVFERSLEKLLISLESGKGGFPTLIWWLDNADYVDDISELVNSMSRNHTFYDTAIVKCSKEALARPEKVREEEIAMLLDNVCLKCGRVFPMMGNTPRRCPSCGGDIDSKYVQITEQLVDMDVAPNPEAVFMAAAYDCLAQAYIDGFIALKRVFSVVRSELHLDSNFQFINEKLKDKLDSIFYYYEAGDVRFAKEERCLLMVLVRATLADLKIARIEDLCRVACDVLKFGHLHNKFYCSGALAQYDNKRVEYSRLYNSINEEIRTTTVIPREKRKQRSVTYLEIRDYKKEIIYPYYATALLPDEFWIRGRLSNNLIYQPLTDIPYLGSPSDAGVTFVAGPSGKGKTTVMSDIIAEVVDRDQCVVLDVLGDDANSLKLASLPMFWRKREITQTKKFTEILDRMKVKPHGIPTVNLTFLRKGEHVSDEDIEANPPTIWDYIVLIKSPSSFGLKFDTPVSYKQSPGILNLLRYRAWMMGYPDIRGIINVMNLDRVEGEGKDKSKPDNLISAEVMSKFCRWRLNNKSFGMMLFADEVSNLAPVQFDSGTGADTSVSSASLAQTIKKVRKRRTSWLLGSQKFSEVNPNVRAEANHVLFRELPQAQDKARSQTDIVLEALQLKAGDGFKKMIRGMIEEGAFPEKEFIWFKHDKNARDLQVIKPNVPYFMLYQRELTMREIFRAYEKWMADLKESDNKEDRALFEYYAMTVGEKVLLKSWRDVPILEYPDDTFKS